ncbi:MAG: hypothetical protein ABJA93_00395 [Sporichthyaceae bacterium]
MSWLDRALGRSKPAAPDLDQLFAVPDAALTLESGIGVHPTGLGSVSFRAAEGGAFASLTDDVQALLDADEGPKVERSVDQFGYTWVLVRREPDDMPGLVTDLHAINSSLQDHGFGPSLLCSLIGFRTLAAAPFGLVYLYKRGTFYPFAPTTEQQRDNALELQVRGLLSNDLRVEPDLARWFPVWGAPGL